LGDFRRSLLLVPYLPIALARVATFAVPLMEIVGGGTLAFGVRFGSVLILVVLIAGAAAAAAAKVHRQEVPCFCFVASDETLSISTIWRNMVFSAIAALPFLVKSPPIGLSAIANALALIFLFLLADAAKANSKLLRYE
jgi:hypothetical protein